MYILGTVCDPTTTTAVATSTPFTGQIPCDTHTIGGNANGTKCTFPFHYKGKNYYTCTTIEDGQPWCSTTEFYVGTWGYCQGKIVPFIGYNYSEIPISHI